MIVYSVQLGLLIGVIGNYAYYMVIAHGDILLLGVRLYLYIEAAACLGLGYLPYCPCLFIIHYFDNAIQKCATSQISLSMKQSKMISKMQ